MVDTLAACAKEITTAGLGNLLHRGGNKAVDLSFLAATSQLNAVSSDKMIALSSSVCASQGSSFKMHTGAMSSIQQLNLHERQLCSFFSENGGNFVWTWWKFECQTFPENEFNTPGSSNVAERMPAPAPFHE